MKSLMTIIPAAMAAAALIAGSAPAFAASDAAQPNARNCFYSTQWRGWKSPSPDVIYIGVSNRDVYRADLSAGSRRLTGPGDNFLIHEVRGSNLICSAIDLDLKVSDGYGFATPLIVKSLVKLTPEQVDAIPPRFRP